MKKTAAIMTLSTIGKNIDKRQAMIAMKTVLMMSIMVTIKLIKKIWINGLTDVYWKTKMMTMRMEMKHLSLKIRQIRHRSQRVI